MSPEVPPSICRVVFATDKRIADGRKRTTVSQCSGVLINRRMVLTAGHCFDDGLPAGSRSTLRVECSVHGVHSDGSYAFSFESSVSAVRIAGSSQDRGSDYAFLRLYDPSPAVPMAIPISVEAFQAELMVASVTAPDNFEIRASTECRFSAFSSKTQRQQGGYVTSDQSPKNGFKAYSNGSMLLMEAYGEGLAKLNPGDAGGPLYCRKTTYSPWKLIAVLSASSTFKMDRSFWSVIPATAFYSAYRQLEKEWK